MPPPVADLSDDESTGESIPYNDAEDYKNGAEEVNDEEEEDVYVVEKIISHKFKSDGTLMLQVKWQGYDDPKDQTLEPEENLLEGAKDVLDEYFAVLGGRPEPPPKKRKSIGRPPKSTPEMTEQEPRKRRKSRANTETETAKENDYPDWVPKSKNWENEVKNVETILREGEGLVAYLHWNNDKKSKVSIETCYERCPRKMLQFYERHLVFKDS